MHLSFTPGEFPQNATPNKTPLWTHKIAAEELAVAALIHSDLMSIRLPNDLVRLPEGKDDGSSRDRWRLLRCNRIDCVVGAVVADCLWQGVPSLIVAAMLQGTIHAQMLAD